MIFLTVGHQTPFDRLVHWTDEWASLHPDKVIFGQVGNAGYWPAHMTAKPYLSPSEFEDQLQRAEAVVAHAGTGTILKALYVGKPLLVVPRLGRLGETRNDHQVGTARHFSDRGLLQMAEDKDGFFGRLDKLCTFCPRQRVSGEAAPDLIQALREFIAR